MSGVALVWDLENGIDLRNSLALKGYRVFGAVDERDAAELIRQHRPALIVHPFRRAACVDSMVRSATPPNGRYTPQLHASSAFARDSA